jgi:glycosyltransferase involved in cell wall biosynthesis
MKIKEAGYRTVHTFDSFVFHFGGKTRKKAEDANFEQHHKEDAENQAIFKRKHSKQLFVLYTGAAWERWSPKNVDQGGIGGSETCAVFLAREFSKRGYEAHVFSDCGDMEGVYDGVQYHKYDQFPQFVSQRYINLFVSSRLTDVFDLPIKAGRKVCWVHDIWLHPDRNASINRDKIDKFICLSPWHRDFFCGHHNIPPSQVCIVRDGIDLNRFNQSQKREKGRIIYSSSPDRGLDVLLTVFPRIRQAVPHATLHVYYGFNNWEKAVVARNNPDEVRRLQYIKQLLNQPGVTFHGRVGQQELALEFLKSELWAYPTYFTETFCITAAEAMASGLPIVTSNLAALNTTVGDAGIILNGDPCSVEYQSRFAEACINILKNPNVWKVASEKSNGKASQFTWSTIVDEWLGQLK